MNNKLFKMIKYNKTIEFNKFIENNNLVDLNIKDEANNYLINYAIITNNIKILKILLKHDTKIDVIDENGRSILFIPIKYEYNDIINILLEYNNRHIGINITDIQDINGNTSLFYATIFKKINILKKILDVSSHNINMTNNKGLTILQYSILIDSIDIMKIILKYSPNINIKNSITGETPIHTAIILKRNDAVKLLLDNNADLNITDNEHYFSALHYSVLKNRGIISDIISRSNLNIQDILGNTALHYAIDDNYFEIFNLINIDKINLKLFNNNHKTLLHKLLEKYNFNKTNSIYKDIINKLLIKSDINYLDFDGNSSLHLLFKTDIWERYIEILKNKNLNILIKNKDNMTPLDFLNNNNDKHRIIEIVINRYLKNIYKSSYNIFDKLCFNKLHNNVDKTLSKDEIDQIIKYFIDKYIDIDNKTSYIQELNSHIGMKSTCKKMLEKIIYFFLETDKVYKCIVKSYPVKYNDNIQFINVHKYSNVNLCTYIGNTIDILFGLIYLLNSYSNVITPIDKNIKNNANLIKIYNGLGYIINEDYEYVNFEIMWINNIIIFPENFDNNIKFSIEFCINHRTQFIIIPIGIEIEKKNHANYLIIDTFNNTIERFEPYGARHPPNMYYRDDLLDDLIYTKFSFFLPNAEYIKPSKYQQTIGLQQFDSWRTNSVIGDPEGFCTVWNIYYIEMRILNHDIKGKHIINALYDLIKTESFTKSSKSILRNYSKNITDLRDNIFHKCDFDINKWINTEVTPEQHKRLQIEINKLLFH
jgi:ankyrin repeat protein